MTTMTSTPSPTLLRRALQGNAVFSTLSGALFILAARPIGAFLGGSIPAWLLVATGVSLLLFAAGLAHNSRREMVSLTEAKIAVGMDMAWVMASVLAVVFANALGLSRPGTWAVIGVADVVLVFAVLQTLGVRRHRRSMPS